MIQSLKDLEGLLKLCRKQGVSEIKLEGCELKFGDLPASHPQKTKAQVSEEDRPTSDNPWADFPDGELTPEQLMFYSAGGKPEEDPYRKDS